MKARWFILFLLFPLIVPVLAQNRDYVKEMENNNLKIRQKPHTERLLSDLLRSSEIKEDTIFAILYSPASCPRCEVAIPTFYEMLKDNSPNNKMLLITALEDSVSAVEYNRLHDYKADYFLYDTKLDYNKVFSFNAGDIRGLYVMKICPKTGVFLTGGVYTVLGKKFIRQLRAYNTRLEPYAYMEDGQEECGKRDLKIKVKSTFGKWKVDDIQIDTKGISMLTKVYDVPKLENGYFFFSEMLCNGIMLFKQDGGRFAYQTLLQVGEDEKNRFIAVPKHYFDDLVKQGQVFYIALSANMIDDRHLGISYSLPKILGEEIDSIYHFSIYNAPAVLIRDITDFSSGGMIAPDFDLEHSNYFHKHFVFDIFKDKLWMECQKITWPMDGFDRESIEGNIEMDSFDDRFYTTFNPILASFDVKSGECNGHYGQLDECQRQTKTGYYFANNVYAHCGNDFLFGNGYTGKLYVSDSTNIGMHGRCYTAFDIQLSSLPEPNADKFYKREYNGLFESAFGRCVTAVKMNERQICCLVKYGAASEDDLQNDRYSYVIINRKNGKRKEYVLPPVPSGVKCLGYGIRNERNNFNPFIFIQDESGFKVRNLMIGK